MTPSEALADPPETLRPLNLARVTRAQAEAALERVLRSDEFAGSPQLSRFLRFVVESELRGDSNALKESSIGLAVFHRGAGYDPKADPIVRVEARRLRSRLVAYYAGAGFADEVRVTLPKPGYVPRFEFVARAPVECEPELAPPPKLKAQSANWRIALGALLLACALGAFVFWTSRTQPPGPGLVSHFWSSFLDGERPVIVIPADSALVLLQDLAHESVALNEYISGEYRARLTRLIPTGVADFGIAQRRYTSIADLEFAARLSHRREAARQGIVTRFARDVRVEDVKRNNLVLLGMRYSNPWVELFEGNATFRLLNNERTKGFSVINTRPDHREPARVEISAGDIRKEIYGVVTYHRNADLSGKVLTVAGTTVAGTEAAADFLLDDARFAVWLQRATVHGDVHGFDILLHDRNLSGSAPRADVVAFHLDP